MAISVTKLKNDCLSIVRQVEITGQAIAITRRGKIVARIAPSVVTVKKAPLKPWEQLRKLGILVDREGQPKLLDLREVVSHMSKMLQRLLGETISLEFRPPNEIPLVQADTGMISDVVDGPRPS